MRNISLTNKIFVGYAIIFALIVSGVIPRVVAIPTILGLLAYALWAPLEEGAVFFIRTVPLFIAIPLTSSYDNLNMWRPLALVLFARLLWESRHIIIQEFRSWAGNTSTWLKTHPVTRRVGILLVLACLSLIGAAHPITGAIRIVYFVNLSMVPVVVYALVRQGKLSSERVITNLAIPVMIVIAVGYLQLASTYLMDVYQFMRLWGENIQLRQFGAEWSHIAVWVGNTWLAYYGAQLSLRVFSLFPDSHSFPTFVLLGIPALFALALDPIVRIAQSEPIKKLIRARSSMMILWVPAAFLIAILSGTRGIWAASVGAAGLVMVLIFAFKRWNVGILQRRMFSYVSSYLILFFMLFAVAWPIFISPQFLLGKADWGLLGNRIRSVIDFGETSNALRIKIWKASIVSIKHHPILGVGIGNYPVVLDQDIQLARAGSTAHNLYLHVASEMGIFAALEMIVLLASAWWASITWFRRATGRSLVYSAAMIIYLPWVLAYVLTDPIIFDERVFLMFATSLALIWAHE
jgi:O-antigen ligase